MSDDKPRKPISFTVPGTVQSEATTIATVKVERKPVAISTKNSAVVIEETTDVFNNYAELDTPIAAPLKRGWTIGSVFLGAVGLLVSFALALWTDALITRLFSRADWLGYLGLGLAAVALTALLVILTREWLALRRLDSVSQTRERATLAYDDNDETKARDIIEKLDKHLKSQPETASGRRHLDETKGEIVDGRDLIRLAETELLAPLDRKAKSLVLGAAKRVSVVTAVSPRALVDVGYILFESFRLIRQLCELYGNRPATLGLLRLAKNVIAHLAVTGSVAIGDSLVQQMLGHGIAAKISARLGEGVINGMMTARIGIAAMDLVRPLPFKAEKRPGIGDFMAELGKFGSEKTK